MIIRIFIALLALNMVAFVVRAEAGERMFTNNMSVQDIYALQEEAARDFERKSSDMYTAIGSRLLSLSLSDSGKKKKAYASDPAQADHGVALLEEGAFVNLKWNF